MGLITIRLVGQTFAKNRLATHAEGQIKEELLDGLTTVKRNGIYYTYRKMNKGVYEFHEIMQPYQVSEF